MIVLILVVVLVVIGGLVGLLATRPSHHVATTTTTVVYVPGQYTVSGNKIIGPNGRQFVPYGIVVYGLSEPTWESYEQGDLERIAAIADFWHANTVRLQVSPMNLFFGPKTAQFLAAVEKEVNYALSFGLDVWICAQYEHTGPAPMPNQTTVNFWQKIATLYKGNPRVWFDLFNEPRLKSGGAKGLAALWTIWQDGAGPYVGMQTLVDTVRGTGADNIILAEGVRFARTLNELPSHRLHGSNIVYEVHAYFVKPGFDKPADWPGNWGDLASTYPIVVGEWSEYEGEKGACVSDPRTLVTEFFNYLASHDIGLIAWALKPGVLIVGDGLTDPTQLSPTVPYVCSPFVNEDEQGAGALVLQYFKEHSHPAPAIAG